MPQEDFNGLANEADQTLVGVGVCANDVEFDYLCNGHYLVIMIIIRFIVDYESSG